MGMNNAFLNRELDEKIYMKNPPSFYKKEKIDTSL